MSPPPPAPSIFHITHVDNLRAIATEGYLRSDATMIQRGGPAAGIGMSTIKQRRLMLPVRCHPGDHVGDYVPFYFCPRSIMLYVISRQNHPDLRYRGGPQPIVHLEADLHEVVAWAAQHACRWAFSLSNAGAVYATFHASIDHLSELDWSAIGARDFRPANVKEAKQAEFLVRDAFPWSLIRRVGVAAQATLDAAHAALAGVPHQPLIEIRTDWYY